MCNNLKKIGILTLNGYNNYGNRLQNYATQEVLNGLGFESETILVDRKSSESKKLLNRFKKISSFKQLYNKFYVKVNNYYYRNVIKKREKSFIEFTKMYINETQYIISNDSIPIDISERYDYFIVGSDQVWNPYNLHGTSFYFLTFVSDKKKKISYAASFGVSEIPDEYVERYKKWLSEIHRISVREETGAKIVKKLSGKDVVVLVDPTMMISKDRWLSIAKESSYKPINKYILTYFLGDMSRSIKDKINLIAKKNKLEVINLLDKKNEGIYTSGPSEFIDFVNSASVLFTDSFHGCVFSILLETPFVVFDRKGSSMYSRIDTLLSKFELESRKAENIKSNDQIFESDYSHIPPILEAERKKALDYLKEALQVRDDC